MALRTNSRCEPQVRSLVRPIVQLTCDSHEDGGSNGAARSSSLQRGRLKGRRHALLRQPKWQTCRIARGRAWSRVLASEKQTAHCSRHSDSRIMGRRIQGSRVRPGNDGQDALLELEGEQRLQIWCRELRRPERPDHLHRKRVSMVRRTVKLPGDKLTLPFRTSPLSPAANPKRARMNSSSAQYSSASAPSRPGSPLARYCRSGFSSGHSCPSCSRGPAWVKPRSIQSPSSRGRSSSVTLVSISFQKMRESDQA